jgi:hypothetical protein
MASKRNQRRQKARSQPVWSSSCQTKKGYEREHQARLAAQDSVRRPDSDVRELWVYECGCGKWHLTRTPGRGSSVTASHLG